jgi:hypothetical protein
VQSAFLTRASVGKQRAEGNDHAVNVQAPDARCSEQIEEKSTGECTDDDIEPETLPLAINNPASNEPGDQAEYDQLTSPSRVSSKKR